MGAGDGGSKGNIIWLMAPPPPCREGHNSLEKHLLLVEEPEEGGLTDQPAPPARLGAGVPGLRHPHLQRVHRGPGVGVPTGAGGPHQVSGVGGQGQWAQRALHSRTLGLGRQRRRRRGAEILVGEKTMGQWPEGQGEMSGMGKGGCWWDRRTLGLLSLLLRLRPPACIDGISCCGR